MNKKNQAGNGSTVAIVIVIIVLLAGAIYVWKSRASNPPGTTGEMDGEFMSDESASSTESALNQQSDSDDLSAIEADLGASAQSY